MRRLAQSHLTNKNALDKKKLIKTRFPEKELKSFVGLGPSFCLTNTYSVFPWSDTDVWNGNSNENGGRSVARRFTLRDSGYELFFFSILCQVLK